MTADTGFPKLLVGLSGEAWFIEYRKSKHSCQYVLYNIYVKTVSSRDAESCRKISLISPALPSDMIAEDAADVRDACMGRRP